VLRELADLHGLVDGQGGVTDLRAGGGWGVAGGDGEVWAGALDRVEVAIAFRAGHGERAGGDEVADRSALAIESHVAAFGVGDGKEVAADAGEADGLCRGGAGIGDGELFERKGVEAEENSGDHYQADQGAHKELLRQGEQRTIAARAGV